MLWVLYCTRRIFRKILTVDLLQTVGLIRWPLTYRYPANTKRSPDVGSILGHRLRRRPNINPANMVSHFLLNNGMVLMRPEIVLANYEKWWRNILMVQYWWTWTGHRTRESHDVAATLNQRQWRWFNVAATSCAPWGRDKPLPFLSFTP